MTGTIEKETAISILEMLQRQNEMIAELIGRMAEDDDSGKWLTTKETMAVLHIDQPQLSRLRRSGRIESRKITAKVYLFSRESVYSFLKGKGGRECQTRMQE